MSELSGIIDDLTARVARKQLNDSDALFAALQENLSSGKKVNRASDDPTVRKAQYKIFSDQLNKDVAYIWLARGRNAKYSSASAAVTGSAVPSIFT